MALDLITTTAGRAEILRALQAQRTITITDVQLSSFVQTFNEFTTELQQPTITVAAAGSVRDTGTGGFVLHLVVIDTSNLLYNLRALAVRLSTGVVLMGCAPGDVIARKTPEASLSLALDLSIDAATAQAITFGTTDFALPPATIARAGVVRMATAAEACSFASERAIDTTTLGAALGRTALHRIWVAPNAVSPAGLSLLRVDSVGISIHRGTIPSGGSLTLRWTMPPVPRGSRFMRAYVYMSRTWNQSDAVLRFQMRFVHTIRRALPPISAELTNTASPNQLGGGAIPQRETTIEAPFAATGLLLDEGSLPGCVVGHEVALELTSMTFNTSHTAETPLLNVYGFGLEYTAPSTAPFLY